MSTVADGVYCFQSTSSAGGKNYLTIKSTGQAGGAPFDASSDTQKFNVTRRADGYYDIVNVGNNTPLRIADPTTTETAYTINTSGSNIIGWDLELKDNQLMIKATGPFASKVVDLSSLDRVVLWERNDLPNQYWVWETAQSISTAALQWVSTSNGKVPANAIKAGYTTDGSPLYIARAFISEGDGYHPGKAATFAPYCWIPYGGTERYFSTYDILVGDSSAYKWVQYPGGKYNSAKLASAAAGGSARPVEGCSEPANGPLYPMRVLINGELTPGKTGAGPSFDRIGNAAGCALVGWGDVERDVDGAYEVICYAP